MGTFLVFTLISLLAFNIILNLRIINIIKIPDETNRLMSGAFEAERIPSGVMADPHVFQVARLHKRRGSVS